MCAILICKCCELYGERERKENFVFERELLCKQKLQNMDINPAGKCLEFETARERTGEYSGNGI